MSTDADDTVLFPPRQHADFVIHYDVPRKVGTGISFIVQLHFHVLIVHTYSGCSAR